MPAIISDQFRILNAETFVNSFVGVGTTANYYYSFLGTPDPQGLSVQVNDYGDNDWNAETPEPRDSFKQENDYHDSMLFLKKITTDDISRIIPRFDWQNGSTYDMYKHNYDINNASPQLNAKTLYESKYIIVNSEYKVYLCVNNGADPENPNGKKSLAEPNFVSITPRQASNTIDDGYYWKYLFTISPADIIKFATEDYIPLPKDWGTGSTASVKNAAIDGFLENHSIEITSRGSNYTLNDGNTIRVPIYGDGVGGEAELSIGGGEIQTAKITSGGSGYTRAFVIIGSGIEGLNTYNVGGQPKQVECTAGSGATFEISIPPKGGHGANIYRELGAHRVMVYSKYDADPDYIVGNTFARIGIVKNPTTYGSKTERLNVSTATALPAIKFAVPNTGDYPLNNKITQTVGVGSTAVGLVASFGEKTGVLRYYQPTGLTTSSSNGYKVLDFSSDGVPSTQINVQNGTALSVDTSFNGSYELINAKYEQFGQTFTNGIAPPDVEQYSGDIIYIDNRAPITRSSSQKEELKIVVEF